MNFDDVDSGVTYEEKKAKFEAFRKQFLEQKEHEEKQKQQMERERIEKAKDDYKKQYGDMKLIDVLLKGNA